MTKGDFFLGVDIGRKRDLTVFWLWEKVGDVLWTRMVHEMRNEPFSRQREFLYGLMEGGASPAPTIGNVGAPLGAPIRRACIDATGIGHQLAEEAVERFGARVEAVTMTAAVKEDLAVTLRRKFEDRLLRVPPDREIREDIHSIRRSATSAGNWRFDSERTEQGHADRFWAAALGAHAAGSVWAPVVYEALERRRFAPLCPMGGDVNPVARL